MFFIVSFFRCSGLYDHLLPIFEKARPASRANVVAVGTGQAIKNAQNCDGDVLLVHAKPIPRNNSSTRATGSNAST